MMLVVDGLNDSAERELVNTPGAGPSGKRELMNYRKWR
jgi:hypothetical protein